MLSAQQIEEICQRSRTCIVEKKYDAALTGFWHVLQVDPEHEEAAYQAARLLISGDRAPRAIAVLERAAKAHPDSDRIFQIWAEAVALGGTAEDIAGFRAALTKSRLKPAVRLPLQDRFGALRKESRPALGGVPKNAIAGLLQLLGQGRFAEAEQRAAAVLRAHPGSAIVANILASAQAAQGKFAAAQTNFQRATTIDPVYAEAFENWGQMLLGMGKVVDAVLVLRRAVAFAPSRARALVGLAEAMTRSGDAATALPLLLRAVAENPTSAEVHAALGNTYGRLTQTERSVENYERAVELSGKNVPIELLISLGDARARSGDDEGALIALHQALASDPENPDAMAIKASVLQTQGKFEDARALFRQSIAINPREGEGYRQLVASYKVKPDDPIIEEMLTVAERGDLSDGSRMNLSFAIGKALEDAKDYDRSFEYLSAANALARKQFPYSITRRFREIRQLKESLDGFDYLGATVPDTTDFGPIFVTGMPRSGTTLVEQIISSHSTVTGAGELGRMSNLCVDTLQMRGEGRLLKDVAQGDLARIGREYEAYVKGRFPGSEKITDKAITSYMYLGMIRLVLPNARIVVVRRDPRDNLLSIYKNRFAEGTHPYAYDLASLARYYGTFVEMVEFWRERVPDWFYEVQYEELVANPEDETRKLIAACGLDWEDACLNFQDNKRKVRTLSVYQARQPISTASVKGWKRYEKELKPMLDALREDGHITD